METHIVVTNNYKGAGAKTKFEEKYCDMLLSHMSQGLSYETFSAVIGVTRKTLYNWEDKHKKWVEAKEKAIELCQTFWEKLGVFGAMGATIKNSKGEVIDYSKVNSAMWIFNMKNRFNWKDRMDMTTDDEKIDGTVVVLPSNGREKTDT